MSFKPVIEELTDRCQTIARVIQMNEKELVEWRQSVEHREKRLAEMKAEYLVWIEATEILIKIEERRAKALSASRAVKPTLDEILGEPPDSVEKDAIKV